MFYLFYGDDDLSRSELMRSLKSRMGDPAMADLNTVTLDGQTTTFRELANACNTLPFVSDRRLVVVDGLLTRLRTKKADGKRKPPSGSADFERQLVDFLKQGLPPTTRLVFLEPGTLTGKDPLNKSPIVKLARKTCPQNVKAFIRPTGHKLTGWIVSRVRKQKANIETAAATEMATICENDLRKLDLEIEKLVLYVDGQRPIAVEDVRALVTDAREANIFDLVDAVGRRQEGTALRLLRQLLEEGYAPHHLLAMITRQVRILLQIKAFSNRETSPSDAASRLRLHPYVIKKGLRQAKRFKTVQLRRGFANLVAADLAIKTGRADPAATLDLLIIALARDEPVSLPVDGDP